MYFCSKHIFHFVSDGKCNADIFDLSMRCLILGETAETNAQVRCLLQSNEASSSEAEYFPDLHSTENNEIRLYKSKETTICENTSLLSARHSFSNLLGLVLAICQFLFPGPDVIVLAVTASSVDDFAKKVQLQLRKVKGFFGSKITENMIVLLAPKSSEVDMNLIGKNQKFLKIVKDAQNCIVLNSDDKSENVKLKLTKTIHNLINANNIGGNKWCGGSTFLMTNKLIVSAVNNLSNRVRYFFGKSGKKGLISKCTNDLHIGDKDSRAGATMMEEQPINPEAEPVKDDLALRTVAVGNKSNDDEEVQSKSTVRRAEDKVTPDSTEAQNSDTRKHSNKRQIGEQTLVEGERQTSDKNMEEQSESTVGASVNKLTPVSMKTHNSLTKKRMCTDKEFGSRSGMEKEGKQTDKKTTDKSGKHTSAGLEGLMYSERHQRDVNVRPVNTEIKEKHYRGSMKDGIRNYQKPETICLEADNHKSIPAKGVIETREVGTCTDNVDVQHNRQCLTGVIKPICSSSMYLKRQESTKSSKSTDKKIWLSANRTRTKYSKEQRSVKRDTSLRRIRKSVRDVKAKVHVEKILAQEVSEITALRERLGKADGIAKMSPKKRKHSEVAHWIESPSKKRME